MFSPRSWILNLKRRSISLFHALSCHPTSQQKQTYLTPKLGIGRFLSKMVTFKLEVSKAKASLRKKPCLVPTCSMYGLFTYIWVVLGVNVGKYTSPIEHLGLFFQQKLRSTTTKNCGRQPKLNW